MKKGADTTNSREGLLKMVSKHRPQIMGFAAMWIFVFHVRNEIILFSKVPVLSRIEVFFDNIGFNGVDIFLLLSGWGLYYAINKYSLVNFYGRRFRRLILPYAASCIFLALHYKWDFLRFIKGLTCWTFLTKSVYETLWFIPAIAILYLFFPLYFKLFNKVSNKYIFTAGSILLWLALAALGAMISDRTDIYLFINRIPVFLMGILFGWMAYNKRNISPRILILFAVMLIAGFQLQYYYAFGKIKVLLPEGRNGLPAFLIAIPMCFAAGLIFNCLDRITFIKKLFGFLGGMSLEIYVVQECVIRFVKESIYYSGAAFDDRIYVLVVLVLTLGIAYVMHLIISVITKKLDGEPVFTVKAEK